MRKFLVALILVLSFGILALPAGASTPSTVSPPAHLVADCSKSVTVGMQTWLRSLPPNTTVVAPPGACYLIDGGITLWGAQGLTIAGGTWEDPTAPPPGASPNDMKPVLWFVGGSNITLENLTITGSSPGGYVAAGAFGAGIRSDGIIGLTVTDVNVDNVWGDGLELAPLRGSNDLSGTILNPSENVSVYGLNVDGAGRQGVSFASVHQANLTAVNLKQIGLNFFDFEADQTNEGATDVTINDCQTGGVGGAFFANAGVSAGTYTGNITVENCTMHQFTAGDPVIVQQYFPQALPRPGINFVNDTIQCGHSVYVACVHVVNADVTVVNSNLVVPGGTIHEAIYSAQDTSNINFSTDTVSGYGSTGWKDADSTVSITGGRWLPYVEPKQGPAPGTQPTIPTTSTTTTPSSTTTTTTTTTTPGVPIPLGTGASGQAPPAVPVPGTALTSDRSGTPVFAFIALDVFAVVVACGLLLLRRRRHPNAAPALYTVQDLLGWQRRHQSNPDAD